MLQPCCWDAARRGLGWVWHCLCRDVYNTLYIFVYKRRKKKKRKKKKKELLFFQSVCVWQWRGGCNGVWEHACYYHGGGGCMPPVCPAF